MSIFPKRNMLAGVLLSATSLLMAQHLDPAARLLVKQQEQNVNQHAQSIDPQTERPSCDELISVYIQYDAATIDWQAIHQLGGKTGVMNGHLATVRIPVDQLKALSEVEGVSYVQAAHKAKPMLDLARADAFVNEAQLVTSSHENLPYTGHGIVIGQVDAGLDYMHNAFKTADGSLRIRRVWEQATDPAKAPISGLHSPEGFGYGAEFDTPELILEAGGDTNAGSHGTHVMGIAAGSDSYLDGQFRGVAPDAELVMVAISEVGPDNVCISDAIKYIFDYADQVNKPCVINLSLGSHEGPHDGTSPFDQIADAMQGPGRLIVGAAGNYGTDKFHISYNYGEMTDNHTPFATIINHEFYTSYAYGNVDIWADSGLSFSLEIFDYNTGMKSESENVILSFDELLDGTVHSVSLGRNVTGTIEFTGEVNPLNGKTHIVLHSLVTGLRTKHVVALRVIPEGGNGQIDLWADDAKLHFDNEQEGFVTHTNESTIVEIGGTAQRILSVGAYTTRDQFQLEGSDTWYPVGMELNNLLTYSGYGPTADDRQKPEVCAPGSFIVSSVSGHDVTQIYMHSHYTDANGHPQRYGYLQGTSMSTPFVTGAVALWLQACPTLTPEQLKEVIDNSSRLDDFTDDPRYWGAGKVNVLAGLQYVISHLTEDALPSIEMTDPAADCIYFDLSGRRLSEAPAHGIFVAGNGSGTRKVVLR